MVTQIVVYLSLVLQIVAMGFAISLFKRTKFNAAWILISTGFFLMAIYRAIELVPSMHRGVGGVVPDEGVVVICYFASLCYRGILYTKSVSVFTSVG